MFARQLVQLADLRFDLGESFGIELERALVTRERIARFIELNLRRIEKVDDRRHARVERGQARRLRMRACDDSDQREFAVAVDALRKAAAALQELACVGESAMFVVECGEIRRRQRVTIELVELMRQPFDAFDVIRTAREFRDTNAGVPPCLGHARDFGAFGQLAGERIE